MGGVGGQGAQVDVSPSWTEGTHGDRPTAIINLTQVHNGILRHCATGGLRTKGDVVKPANAVADRAMRPTHLDLEAIGAQGLHLLLAPLDQGDGTIQGGVQVEGVDLLQGGDPVGVHVDEVGAVGQGGVHAGDDEGG